LPNIHRDIKGLVLAGFAPMVVVNKTVKFLLWIRKGNPKQRL